MTPTHPQENPRDRDDVVLEVPHGEYTYIGEDSEGYHHHLHTDFGADKSTLTVYVTDEAPEEYVPEHCTSYAYVRIRGEVDTTECLSDHENRDLGTWIGFVDDRRGWADLRIKKLLTADELFGELGRQLETNI